MLHAWRPRFLHPDVAVEGLSTTVLNDGLKLKAMNKLKEKITMKGTILWSN